MRDSPIAFPWRRELGGGTLTALVPLLLILAFLLFGDEFSLCVDDGRISYQPIVTDSLNQFFAGSLPLWSHHTACGYPLLARGQQVIYPPYYLARVLCLVLGVAHEEVTIAYLLHLFVGTILTFLYLRFNDVGLAAAVMGAWGYALSGPLLGFWTTWPTYAYMTVWLLLAMLIVERVRAGPVGLFWMCAWALCGGMVLLITDPMLVIKFCLFMVLYFLLRGGLSHFRQMAIPLLLGSVGAALIGMGQVLATMEMVSMSARLDEATRGNPYFLSLLPSGLVGLVFPFADFPWPQPWATNDYLSAGGLFFGPLLALALLAPFALPGRRLPRLLSHLVLLFGLYLLLALGDHFPPNYLLPQLPVFQHFRFPLRWVLEMGTLAPLLIGVGLGMLERHFAELKRGRLAAGFLVLLGGALAMASLSPPHEFFGLTWAAYGVWLLGSGVLVFTLLQGRQQAFVGTAIVFTLAALVVNVPAAQRNNFSRPGLRHLLNDPVELPGDPQRVLYLARHREMRRPPGEGNFAYSIPHILGSRTVLGYRYRLGVQMWSEHTGDMGEVFEERGAIETFLNHHLLETLRVDWVVVPRVNTELCDACDRHADLRLDRHSSHLRIYRHLGFREPAFFVQHLHSETELGSLRELGHLPLRDHAHVGPDYTGPMHFPGGGRVEDFSEEHGLIRCRAITEQPGFLVVTTSWWPGWHATVNGQAVPLQRTNSSFMGLTVPAGTHEIELRFRPLGIICWTLVGFAATAILSLICLLHLLRRLAA